MTLVSVSLNSMKLYQWGIVGLRVNFEELYSNI